MRRAHKWCRPKPIETRSGELHHIWTKCTEDDGQQSGPDDRRAPTDAIRCECTEHAADWRLLTRSSSYTLMISLAALLNEKTGQPEPNISMLITMSLIEPTNSRGSSVSPKRWSAVRLVVLVANSCGRGGKSRLADSSSIFIISSPASAKRHFYTSRRGDSGMDFRRYQTMPAIKKTGRQPK